MQASPLGATPFRRPPAAPVFAAAVAFSLGIVLEAHIYHPPYYWLSCSLIAAALACAALLWSRTRGALVAYLATLAAFVAAGGFVSQARQSQPAPEASIVQFSSGDEVVLTGYVARDGSMRRDARESLDIAVETAQYADQPARAASGVARLSVYVPGRRPAWVEAEEDDQDQQAELPQFTYGQRIRLTAKLRPLTTYRNPGDMDAIAYMHSQGVAVWGSARSTSVEVLPGRGGSWVESVRSTARRSVLNHMAHIWTQPQAGLFQAMIIGEKGMVSREERLEFQRSGTFHLLVVSGMNVGVFAVFLLWITRRLHLPVEVGTIATLVLTCGYAWLTDLGAPILRSVLMIAVYQVTRMLYRDRSPLNTVAVAALVILAWAPEQLLQASFQLTFLAVLTIAGIAVPIFDRTSQPYERALQNLWTVGYDQAMAAKQAQFRLDLRLLASRFSALIGKRLSQWLVVGTLRGVLAVFELAALSLLMQLALALPSIWYFHRLGHGALWANMAVLPLTSVLMPSGVLAVALSYAGSAAAWPFAKIASAALSGITVTVHWAGGAQIADPRIAMPAFWTLLAVVGAYALALLVARRHAVLATAGAMALAASAWAVYTHSRPLQYEQGRLEITAIDVGQGDSFLIVTPHGKTLLLDSGGLLGSSHAQLDIGDDVVSPYLWWRGIGHLDAVAFSHGHADHMGGMRAIIRNFHPDELWYAPNFETREFDELMQTADAFHVVRKERHFGDRFEFDGVRFRVLSPPGDWELKPKGQDDSSLAMRVDYAGHSALLIGDIHKKMEKRLIEDHEPVHVDLLKVAHHGSNTSSCDEFLDVVRPRYAVISAGIRNPFRHPRPETLERLYAHHVATWRTDLFGPITFYIDENGVQAGAAGKECKEITAPGWPTRWLGN